MGDHDEVIRIAMRPDGSRSPLTLNSEVLLALHGDARRRLERALPAGGVGLAIAETRAVAVRVSEEIDGMAADAASLSALFLLANEDLLPSLPSHTADAVHAYREEFGEDIVNELSALCQLEDWPGFFATATQASLQSYLDRYVMTGDHNVLIRECLLDLDED